jgi:hypothetical protein
MAKPLQVEVSGLPFTKLVDVPQSYDAASAGQVAAVNAAKDGLEFVTVAGAPNLAAGVEVSSGRTVVGQATFFKLVDIGTLPNNGTKNVAHGIAATFRVVQAYGIANDPVADLAFPVVFSTTSFDTNTIYYMISATNVSVVTGSDRTGFTESYVVLEYYYV